MDRQARKYKIKEKKYISKIKEINKRWSMCIMGSPQANDQHISIFEKNTFKLKHSPEAVAAHAEQTIKTLSFSKSIHNKS